MAIVSQPSSLVVLTLLALLLVAMTMVSQPSSLVVLLLLVALLLLFSLIRRRHHHNHSVASLSFPPSPPLDLPFIGHLLLLPRFFTSSFAHQHLKLLGPIFSLRFGSMRIVFITSASLIHEALLLKGSFFSSRYQSPSIAILNPNYCAIGVSNGTSWATARKNLVHHMLSPKSLPAFAPARERSIDFMIQRLCQESERGDGTIAALVNFRMAIMHFMISACFGYIIDEEEVLREISETLEAISALFYPLFFADLYPILRPFIIPTLRRKARAHIAKQSELLIPLIRQHQEKQKSSNCDLIPGNYLESLLPQMVDSSVIEPSTSQTMADIVTLCAEFVEASVASGGVTLEWVMARLVKDPSIQQKLYDHILDVVGDKLVEEDDLTKLPYLEAVVMETLRLHTPTPFLIPRQMTERCEVGGYEIPKGTMVNVYVSGLGMDPEVWEDPKEFRPERMVGAEVDMTGTKNSKLTMLPFGAGRRSCPGWTFGIRNIEMVVARAVQEFQWMGDNVDLREGFGQASNMMANRLRPRLRRRNSPR